MTKSQNKRKSAGVTYHTLESLKALTVEVGDCREFTGYMVRNVPYVAHGGVMKSVRRLLLELQGVVLEKSDQAGCTCRNSRCVAVEHIEKRTAKQHSKVMSKSPNRNQTAISRVLADKARQSRAKLTMDIAREIRLSEETGPVLAEKYGVHRGLINRIRRNQSWKEYSGSSPFAGLGAR